MGQGSSGWVVSTWGLRRRARGGAISRTQPSSEPPYRVVGIFAIGLVSACALLGLYSVDASRDTNALELPSQPKFLLQQLMPEGWAFFTRNPREERIHVFAETAGGWVTADPGPHATWRYAMGFDRRPRVYGIDLALLLAQLQEPAWAECRQKPIACPATVETADDVVNTNPDPAYCGPIGIVRQPPVPWAWARSADAITLPSQVLRLDVQC